MPLTRPPMPPPSAVRLQRRWLEQHIPHQGRMCLLEAVLGWDLTQIRCRASSHCRTDNPLRARGRLPAVAGIEYAGQAMAAHGALMAGLRQTRVRTGYLASVRNLHLHVPWLDEITAPLLVSARRIAGDEDSALYQFTLACEGRELLSGRAGIVFGALEPDTGSVQA